MKDYFKRGLISLVFLITLPALSIAEKSGEELYNQGKFKEALQAFTEADMDHPKEARFRYNRGCAAFQDSDIDASEAAFTSVLKRTDDTEIRFRSFYNRGVTAFKKEDFGSASEDFKEALKLNPSDEDAKYNFELSLRRKVKAEEKKKQTKDEPKDKNNDQSEKDGDKSEKKDSRGDKEDSKDKDRPDEEKENDNSNEEEGQGQRENQQDKQKEEQEDLSGDLEGKDRDDPLNEKVPEPTPLTDSQMAKNKAEALLENVKDDRSILLNAMKAQEKEAGKSGKKW